MNKIVLKVADQLGSAGWLNGVELSREKHKQLQRRRNWPSPRPTECMSINHTLLQLHLELYFKFGICNLRLAGLTWSAVIIVVGQITSALISVKNEMQIYPVVSDYSSK